MPSRRVGPLTFGYFPKEDRCWLPRFGILSTRSEDAIASWWLAEDGVLDAYAYWICFEIAVRLKTRPAKGIKGYVKGGRSDG